VQTPITLALNDVECGPHDRAVWPGAVVPVGSSGEGLELGATLGIERRTRREENAEILELL
jgi:hypothetical protein